MFKVLLDKVNKADSCIAVLQAGAIDSQPSTASLPNFASPFNSPPSMANPSNQSMDDLRARISKLEVATKTGDITFTQQLRLLSLDDTLACWSALNIPSCCFGLYMDVFLLMDRMADDSHSVQQNMLTMIYKQVHLKIQTGSEALALGALRQLVPPLFDSTSYNWSQHVLWNHQASIVSQSSRDK
jgi:hypothetical protein